MDKRHCYLSVAGWRYPRHTIIDGNVIMMEVAMGSCQHCPTCSRRVEMVSSRLRGTNSKWSWEGFGNGLYLKVEMPDDAEQVEQYLSRLIGVSVWLR